jgi:hypothetical protein
MKLLDKLSKLDGNLYINQDICILSRLIWKNL